MSDIIYMTEKELLNTHFSFIFKVKYVEDGHVPIGYDTIGVLGKYGEYYTTLMQEHDKCKSYDLPLLPDRGNFYSLKSSYVDSEHANYYGKSDIFTKQSYIDNILKHLPIVLKDGECKKYYNLIYSDYSIKKFNNELVANSNISSETRDLFYGTDKEVNELIKQLKKLDARN